MGFAARQKESGIRLELTWFEARKIWKKKFEGKTIYFKHPDTKTGYEAALKDWFDFKSSQTKNPVIEHHQNLFEQVLKWWDSFGVPANEAKLYDQVTAFLHWLKELPSGHQYNPLPAFCTDGIRKEFYKAFVVWNRTSGFSDFGYQHYQLPPQWIDRLDRISNTNVAKEPQTIGYWLEQYIHRTNGRADTLSIEKITARDRKYKLSHFTGWCKPLDHVNTVNNDLVEEYHNALNVCGTLTKSSKEGYWKAFGMFVTWCSNNNKCDMTYPSTLKSMEYTFRELEGTGRKRMQKKSLLWSPEDFEKALKTLDAKTQCCLMLMLNCGFRHVDLGHLRHTDYLPEEGRIIYQRHKLSQQDSAPVISYKLWDRTIELLEEEKSENSMYVFTNREGGTIEDSLKTWWKRNGIKKRLDYLRKTGSTSIARFDRGLDVFYLGECLTETAKLSYSFRDGEPCPALDDAIQNLGAEFGFAEKPFERVQLTPEMLKKLKLAGVEI